MFKIKFKLPFRRRHPLMMARSVALHSSAAGFSLDFAHAMFGPAMILYPMWEVGHEFLVSYSAFAATIIVYIDGHREHINNVKEAAKLRAERITMEAGDKA